MDIQQLRTLGLEKKWPKLARLQDEVSSLERRLQAAEVQVRTLQNQLGPARDRDLDAAADAVRAGKDVPHGTHEDSAKRQLQAAERDRDVLAKAVESARADLAQFMAKHGLALFEDVAGARAEIAREVAKSAQEALQGFARWSDMHYTLKSLQPVEVVEDYVGPANPNSVSIIGVATRASQGPERGHVEGILQHLISLAEPAAGGAAAPADVPGGSDAA